MQAAGHSIRNGQHYADTLCQRAVKYQGIRIRPCFELMVHSQGTVITAQPLLTFLKNAKVVYGSGDGGESVAYDAAVHAVLSELAATLHLAEHTVVQTDTTLACACDMEVKQLQDLFSSDGIKRFALMDLARALPAEAPGVMDHLPRTGQTIFYRMLRLEFLTIWAHWPITIAQGVLPNIHANSLPERSETKEGKAKERALAANPPLSPDAFSGFGKSKDGSHLELNANVRRATEFLRDTIVPKFAALMMTLALQCNLVKYSSWHAAYHARLTWLVQNLRDDSYAWGLEGELEDSTVAGVATRSQGDEPQGDEPQGDEQAPLQLPWSAVMHAYGINVRLLGLVRHHVLAVNMNPPVTAFLADSMLLEMVARALKIIARERMRTRHQGTSHMQHTASFLNQILHYDVQAGESASVSVWAGVGQHVHDKFGRLVTELPASGLYALCKPHLGALLCYVVEAAPLAVAPRSMSECLKALEQPPSTGGEWCFTFDRVDIPREPALRAKHMTILKYARVRAEVIAMTAMKSKDTRRRKAYELRRQAADALSSNPRHKMMRALKQQLDVMIDQDVTLVHMAARDGNLELLRELAELVGEAFQVQWDLLDANYCTPAMLAFEAKQDSCVDFLVSLGAKTPTEVSVSARASCSLFILRALRHYHPFSPS